MEKRSKIRNFNFFLIFFITNSHFLKISGIFITIQLWSNLYRTSCKSLKSHPEINITKLVAYIWEDISDNTLKAYLNVCIGVEIRRLDFDRFPDYVKIPKQYRFKHIIIAEMLRTEKLVLYADSSIMFVNRGPKVTFQVGISGSRKSFQEAHL